MTARESLADFQDGFSRALGDEPADTCPEMKTLMRQPGFAVYRNTVTKACIDALQANFPSVARLVGEEWFRAAAAIHAQACRPSEPCLLRYGERFPEFLGQFPPAAGLPYLPGVAKLDRYWTEAHAATDETPLDPACLSHIPAEILGRLVLHPHPAARWQWFAAAPVYSIWRRNRRNESLDDEIVWKGEGVLLVRPGGVVDAMPLNEAGCAFMDACRSGIPLAGAAARALAVDKDTDLAQLLAVLLAAGAFGRSSDPDQPLNMKE